MAAFGILTGAVGIVAEVLRPVIGDGYLLYGLLLPAGCALTAWTLHTLGRRPRDSVIGSSSDLVTGHSRLPD